LISPVHSPARERALTGHGASAAVEAGAGFGWERWIGDRGGKLTVETFGASAPGGEVLARYGFTVENLVAVVKRTIAG